MVQVMRREEIPGFSSRESKSHQILTGVNLKLQSLNHKFWHRHITNQSSNNPHPKNIRSFLWFLQRLQFQKLVFCGLDTCHVSFKVMDFISKWRFRWVGSSDWYPFRICCFLKLPIALCFWFHFFGSSSFSSFFHNFCLQNSSLHQGKPRLHDASTRGSISLL